VQVLYERLGGGKWTRSVVGGVWGGCGRHVRHLVCRFLLAGWGRVYLFLCVFFCRCVVYVGRVLCCFAMVVFFCVYGAVLSFISGGHLSFGIYGLLSWLGGLAWSWAYFSSR